jgi:UDP-N-acetylmuramoyl-L-alanyl-D-glutamate--2,6-diaminopimelate ligase
MNEGVTLHDLAERVPGRVTILGATTSVVDVTRDSREVLPGWLFVAVRGDAIDGHDYVNDAVTRGAAAVAVEEKVAVGVPQLLVADTRRALPWMAAIVHGDPSRKLTVVGVTGTNGKTTVTHMLESIADEAGLVAGVIGTVGARIAGASVPVPRTTPEGSDLHRLLAQMARAGVEMAAIEVSSHALNLGRVDGVWFRTAAFTNLSQDHLDFHGDMGAYRDAKASLFEESRAASAVICVDDEAGQWIAKASNIPVTTVSVHGVADVMVPERSSSLAGSRFVIAAGERPPFPVDLAVPGEFNVANALVAAAIALELGIEPDAVSRGLARLAPIPGRFERVDKGQPFEVVVDYAHTPDAVATVVRATRAITSGRIFVVVGAGGDRDRDKRPAMGRAAAESDLVIVTSDNPRSEDPAAIVAAVAEGARRSGATVVEEPDRKAAIGLAISQARAGDVVLVLGKGHEQGQEIGGAILPFDDRTEAVRHLRPHRQAGR